MTDPRRSALMKRVRRRSTAPEMEVRSRLHRAGFRFRVNVKSLPGSPDIVLPRYRTAVFVHGCFWHGHSCRAGKLPKTNREFWQNKIEANRRRDASKEDKLVALGWKVVPIWTCELDSGIRGLLDTLSRNRCRLVEEVGD